MYEAAELNRTFAHRKDSPWGIILLPCGPIVLFCLVCISRQGRTSWFRVTNGREMLWFGVNNQRGEKRPIRLKEAKRVCYGRRMSQVSLNERSSNCFAALNLIKHRAPWIVPGTQLQSFRKQASHD